MQDKIDCHQKNVGNLNNRSQLFTQTTIVGWLGQAVMFIGILTIKLKVFTFKINTSVHRMM